jgi:hypothetical protein
MKMPTLPKDDEAFNCPLCGAYAHQIRHNIATTQFLHEYTPIDDFTVTKCSRCGEYAIWLRKNNQMVYPLVGDAPLPNEDLPNEIKEDYLEARTILAQSPRGAAALLRLAIDKLCDHLKAGGDNLNQKVKNLVAKGLPEKVQKALDIVRVTGNNAVHPGQIDVDNIDTAKALFELVNIIANHMISENKQIDSIYDKLPDSVKKEISKRDNKSD